MCVWVCGRMVSGVREGGRNEKLSVLKLSQLMADIHQAIQSPTSYDSHCAFSPIHLHVTHTHSHTVCTHTRSQIQTHKTPTGQGSTIKMLLCCLRRAVKVDFGCYRMCCIVVRSCVSNGRCFTLSRPECADNNGAALGLVGVTPFLMLELFMYFFLLVDSFLF